MNSKLLDKRKIELLSLNPTFLAILRTWQSLISAYNRRRSTVAADAVVMSITTHWRTSLIRGFFFRRVLLLPMIFFSLVFFASLSPPQTSKPVHFTQKITAASLWYSLTSWRLAGFSSRGKPNRLHSSHTRKFSHTLSLANSLWRDDVDDYFFAVRNKTLLFTFSIEGSNTKGLIVCHALVTFFLFGFSYWTLFGAAACRGVRIDGVRL